MEPDARAVVSQVAHDLLAEQQQVTRELADFFIELIPEFRHDETVRRLMVASTGANVAAILDVLMHDIPLERITIPPAAAEYARRFAQHELPLEALVRAYRIGEPRFVAAMGERIKARADDLDVATALTAMSDMALRANGYIDRVLEQLIAIYETERRSWDSRAGARRAAQLRTLTEHEGISFDAAQAMVEVPLDGHHQALVAWVDEGVLDTSPLREVVLVAGTLSGLTPLTLLADDHTVWAWLSGPTRPALDQSSLADAVRHLPVRVVLGSVGTGLDGFRGTLREAQRTRAVAAGMDAPPPVLAFDDVAALALLTADIPDVRRWVGRTLCGLAGEDDASVQLRQTVLVFLRANGSYTQAAAHLHVHKNTVHYRIRKAEEQLGRAPMDDRLGLELALMAHEQVRNR